MLFLASTTDAIKLVTASALTIDVHASWVDRTGTTDTVGRTNTAITGATTTTVVAANASSSYTRNVRTLSICNKDVSSNVITVQHYDGTTTIQLIKMTLKAGYTLAYCDQLWTLSDTAGAQVVTPLTGRYLGSTVLTSASANFTTGTETNVIVIRGVAGGGAGGGCTSVASACAAAGGGGAGGYVEKTFTVSPNTAYAYTCGAGGTGSAGAAGGDGTNSTFIVGATTVTAIKGLGGPQAVSATTLKTFLGGGGGTISTNGDLNAAGQPGYPGFTLIVSSGTAEIQMAGAGGQTIFGAGGAPLITTGAGATGNNAVGFGAGGGGSCTGASQTRAGGNGGNGCWVVDEYS